MFWISLILFINLSYSLPNNYKNTYINQYYDDFKNINEQHRVRCHTICEKVYINCLTTHIQTIRKNVHSKPGTLLDDMMFCYKKKDKCSRLCEYVHTLSWRSVELARGKKEGDRVTKKKKNVSHGISKKLALCGIKKKKYKIERNRKLLLKYENELY